jgi:hypothetical protein
VAIKDKMDFVILKTKVEEARESATNPVERQVFTGLQRILDLAFPRLKEECEETYSD